MTKDMVDPPPPPPTDFKEAIKKMGKKISSGEPGSKGELVSFQDLAEKAKKEEREKKLAEITHARIMLQVAKNLQKLWPMMPGFGSGLAEFLLEGYKKYPFILNFLFNKAGVNLALLYKQAKDELREEILNPKKEDK